VINFLPLSLSGKKSLLDNKRKEAQEGSDVDTFSTIKVRYERTKSEFE
jgi:hypothetical protein